VYRLLEHDSQDRLPAMADAYHKGISLVTLSKPWGGCGITIGWQEIFPLLYHHALLAHSSVDELIDCIIWRLAFGHYPHYYRDDLIY
jgi:hypothetical protein